MTPGSTGSTSTAGRSIATTRRPASTSSVRHRDVRARWPSPPPRDDSSSRWRAGSASSTGHRERGATGSRSSRRAQAIASTTGAAIRRVDSGSARCSTPLRPARRRGILHRVEPDGSAVTVRSGIGVANGLAFAPDGRTMYFADTPRETVWAYDYDVDTGEASDERVFLDFGPLPGRPDGAAVDEAGCYWIACVYGRDGPPGHAGRGDRPTDPRARRRSRRCRRSAAPGSRPCSSRRSVAADRTRSTRASPTRAACSRSKPVSAGCPSRGSAAARPRG